MEPKFIQLHRISRPQAQRSAFIRICNAFARPHSLIIPWYYLLSIKKLILWLFKGEAVLHLHLGCRHIETVQRQLVTPKLPPSSPKEWLQKWQCQWCWWGWLHLYQRAYCYLIILLSAHGYCVHLEHLQKTRSFCNIKHCHCFVQCTCVYYIQKPHTEIWINQVHVTHL